MDDEGHLAADNLTDREYWLEYWNDFVATPENEEHNLSAVFTRLPGPGSSFLEIGGFPGRTAAYFKKFRQYDVTLLDFITLPAPIRSVERVNGLPNGSIKSIEADFSTYTPQQTFDVVYSGGFIEHFADTAAVIEKHCECLNPGGTLFVVLPNLRGISGWALWALDRKTYDAHNLDCMDVPLLRSICERAGLHSVSVFYHGTPWIWLDRPEQVSPVVKLLIKFVNKLVSRVTVKTRYLSPSIVVLGTK